MATELTFKATVSRICDFEKRSGKSLMSVFSGNDISISSVIDLVKALTGVDDDDVIDAYVKEHGFEGLAEALQKSLLESGFLPKAAT